MNLASPVGAFIGCEDPDVGRDARVVEELVGERDDGFEPVILDYPAADAALAALSASRKERRAVEDNGEPRLITPAIRSGALIYVRFSLCRLKD